ncbi:MAG TPA: 4'-phosphopantetheinyl transferase superfamily protein [Thermomicrobiales bacterium]
MTVTRTARNAPSERVEWQETTVASALPAGEIHLWRANLDLDADATAGLRRLLALDEVARAGRYRRAIDRDRFIVARGTLRVLLGRYLSLAPASLRFQYNCACGRPNCTPEQRKPALDPADGGGWLHFNVSHAEGVALYALARDRPVGVDLEWCHADLDPADLAPTVLAPQEWATVATLPPAEQRPQFFQRWTAKEAYLKARGVGLSLPPAQIVLAAADHDRLRIASVAGDEREGSHWSLHAVAPIPGYAIALVGAGSPATVRTFTFPTGPVATP